MSRTTVLAVGAATAAIATGTAVAAAAEPPVGPQQTWAGARTPVSVPGNHLHRGTKIPRGAKLVLREIHLDAGRRSTLRLTVPVGYRITGLASSGDVRWSLPGRNVRYVGHRRVTVDVAATKREAVSGAIYALGRR